MFKKLFAIAVISMALFGCDNKVSGKFTGQWVEPNGTVTIIDKGDYYQVHHVDKTFGRDSTFDVIEDGNYLRSKSSNRVEYTLISPTELGMGNKTKVMWTKK